MKKTTKFLAATVATAIIATGTMSVYANGQGNGQGGGMGKNLTTEQRAEMQSMSESERQAYMQVLKNNSSNSVKTSGQGQGKGGNSSSQTKHSGSPEDMIQDIAPSDLSEQEKLDLAYQYSEEMVARDAYNYFYSLYGVETFKNIAESEAEHMAAVKVLLDRYSLPIPITYGELEDEFDTLKAEGEKGLKEALEVGLKIEMLDIKDIKETIKSTDNDDIKIVFTNIGGASYNHMRGFVKGLSNAGITTSIDYSSYLTAEQVNSSGTIKHLLAEDLVSEGVVLPAQASVENIKANCDNEAKNINSQQNKDQGNTNISQIEKEQYTYSVQLKEQYKKSYEVKYGTIISSMNTASIEKLIIKIDTTLEKIELGNDSQLLKQKYRAMLTALKEIAQENINEEENVLDALFQ